jgi:hypothetical protein
MITYIKKFSMLLLAFTLASCSAISYYKKTKDISAERATKECITPTEVYAVPPTTYGTDVRIMRHNDCMGIPDMLMMLWGGDKSELNEAIVKVIMLMYIDSMNINNKIQHGRVFLKYDKLGTGGLHVKFYELMEVDPEDFKNKNDKDTEE